MSLPLGLTDVQRRVIDWYVYSDDTGVSSVALAFAAVQLPNPERWIMGPSDADDFGRCRRLVELIPGIRSEFDRIAADLAGLRPMLANWEQLVRLHDEVLALGVPSKKNDVWNHPSNQRLRALLGER